MLGALLVGYGAPGYLAMGVAAGAVVVVGTLLSAWGLAPAARVCRRPSGSPEPITARWDESGAMAASCGWWACISCSGERCN